MTANVTLPGAGAVVATDDVAGAQFQRVKLDLGAVGASAPLGAGNGLPVVGSALIRTVMLNAVGAVGAGTAAADSGRPPSFSVDLAGTGAVSATTLIQGRNVSSGQWVTLATVTLSGATTAGDGFACPVRYMEYRANCTAISGTGATVTVAMGS